MGYSDLFEGNPSLDLMVEHIFAEDLIYYNGTFYGHSGASLTTKIDGKQYIVGVYRGF